MPRRRREAPRHRDDAIDASSKSRAVRKVGVETAARRDTHQNRDFVASRRTPRPTGVDVALERAPELILQYQAGRT